MTFSVTWFIGQFQGVIRPTTPIGSHATMLEGVSGRSGRMNSKLRNASMKVAIWPAPQPAWSSIAMSCGAPISYSMARPISA